jgi:pimeloyl-ACP methyl ester carboxylesterase
MDGAPAILQVLVDRFDSRVLPVGRGEVRIRLVVSDDGRWDVTLRDGVRSARLMRAASGRAPDAVLTADRATWERIARELPAGMEAYRAGRLRVRRNLHLGVGFLAATSGASGPGRLCFRRVRTRLGSLSTLEAGVGPPVVMLHGLGATKVSFLPTVAALAGSRRMIAVDLPGFGDSDKPLAGSYDPRFFARWTVALLDELGLERADVVGHSLGGRAALEVGFAYPRRVDRLVLMTPSLAWLRERRWAPWLRLVRPELGLLQPAPRAISEPIVRSLIPGATGDGWAAAGADEFLRTYLTARGRAAFYAAARNIYLEEPEKFWRRLAQLAADSLFIWGRSDPLVPLGFARHVQRALPAARHVELDCGHIPQLECPRETHEAIAGFLASRGSAAA